jgi:hypothetical protein
MSNIIRFLQDMGGKPALGAAEYAASVAALNADTPQTQALLDRDPDALNGLLSGRKKVLCAIFAEDEED